MPAERPGEPPRSIPISALEHYPYCPRQAALIHVDGYFDASLDTMRGDLAHQAIDRGGTSVDRRQRTVRSLPVWSTALGLDGVCDAVQFDEHQRPLRLVDLDAAAVLRDDRGSQRAGHGEADA